LNQVGLIFTIKELDKSLYNLLKFDSQEKADTASTVQRSSSNS